MKYAVKIGLPICLLFVLISAGCNDETEPLFTRLIIAPQCGVVPLEIEGYATVSGGNETGDPTGSTNNLEMTWDFDDGSTGSTSIAYHVFDEPGIFNVTVTATDPDGKTTEISMPVTVRADTLSVWATSNFHGEMINEGEDGLVPTGEDIFFNVFAESCEIDRDNDEHYRNLNFVWHMNDADEQEFYSRDPIFAFDVAGEYEVTVDIFMPKLAVVRHSSLQIIVSDP
ncbi:MAG: PKD domain-containing protein [Gemmatimonadales bacterium]|nr:PKD domain-containing protein [Gemmatimonadales bacterium]